MRIWWIITLMFAASARAFTLDYATPVDPALQAQVEALDVRLRAKYGMTTEQTAVGVLDLTTNRVAMIHPDRIEYAASVAKIGILLAYFELNGKVDDTVRHELALMVRPSSNEMAAKYSRALGLREIQQVLNRYGFYDASHGGGIWVGKHYGPNSERIGDPVADHSHAATIRQLLRYSLMLEQGELVSPAASKTMREIFATPDIPHDDIKFVHGLAGRNVEIIRKWGSWQDYLHDSAVVTGGGRHYIVAALTHHPRGDDYLVELARGVDDLLRGLVIHDVTVIDGGVREHQDIVMRGDRIVSVGAHADHPGNVEVIDGSGKYVIPGLIDMHVHVLAHPWDEQGNLRPRFDRDASLAMLDLLVQNGVTTIRDPGSETEAAVTLRDMIHRGEIRGPRIFTAGRIINSSSFDPEPFAPVRDADDVRREIRYQKAAGVDFIKIYASMPPELTKVAIDEAHALELPIIGHLQRTTWTDAANLGIDGIEHFAPWSPESLPEATRAAYPQTMFGRVYWLEHVDVNGPEITAMASAMKEHDVTLDPTLIALHTKFFGNDARWTRNPDIARAPRAFTAGWAAGSFTKDWTDAQYAQAQRTWPKELALIKRLYDAGVTMTVGTDTPTPWIVPGSSVHDEMALLVSAGIAPAAVLEMATRNAARALRQEKELGRIEAGYRADLVLLAKNPLERIENTRAIEQVIAGGLSWSAAAKLPL